ncbi:MAG: redox-regulated ATPase YchF [Anaeroplasmataceae bacterium]
MALTAGIVGLPNVGKSTLFNAITKAGALAANYPFATIEPNVGVVEVPDERLNKLNEMYKPKSLVHAFCEFTDIAGLVKGASKGEGLGNQFLGNIRQCDAILEVVRCFDDNNITHVEGEVSPVRDVEIIGLELILSDLEIVQKRIEKIAKKAQSKVDGAEIEFEILKRIEASLLDNKAIRTIEFTKEEYEIIKNYGFLTAKKIMYVANMSETEIGNPSASRYYNELCEYASSEGSKVIPICAEIESQLSELDEEEREMFLVDLGIPEAGLNLLIRETYDMLGLATYFTAGEKEVRAWTFKKGMTAPECAGIIHTDFQRGFIRAETVAYTDLVSYGSYLKCKEAGKVRQEGKDYIVSDGDVMLFKFNV